MNDPSGSEKRNWPHAPPHRLAESGIYFVTSRTLDRVACFESDDRKDFVQDTLFTLAKRYGWPLEAWAVLSNHYHLVAHSPADQSDASSLRIWLRHLHADISREMNRRDGAQGRKLWHNYRETHLTYERSYFSRLAYTHFNPVHHGLVTDAAEYPWCSAREFAEHSPASRVATLRSFAFDQIAKDDGE